MSSLRGEVTLSRVPDVEIRPDLGISQDEAARRLLAEGRNETPQPAAPTVLRRVYRQLADPLIILLLASAAVTAVARDAPDTAVILLVIVVNTVIGVTQEIRADRAVAALRRLAAPTCRVFRDGADRLVPTAEVVRGDLVLLSAGDIVPADATVVEAHRLQLDESALTGESVAVHREAGQDLSSGTVVTAGRGAATVTRTGPDSALGRIVTLTETAQIAATPLQRRLARFGRVLGTWIVALSALVTAIGIIRGRPVLEMAIVGVSLVVAAVPESLPAVVSLALALGARRMAGRQAITRQLSAVETLGSVDTLLSDKTGTLTQGRMAVQRAVTASGAQYHVSGTGYRPVGEVAGDTGAGEVTSIDDAALAELARAAVLCNDARLVAPAADQPDWTVAGEQIEGALLAFAARARVSVDGVRDAWPRIAEEPFDQQTRMMTTEHRAPDGSRYVARKGAPEAVLSGALGDTDAQGFDRLRAAATRLAADGLRPLAVTGGPPGQLRALGVLGIGDPVRDDASMVLRRLGAAGIRTVVVTGDHPQTARHVATELGIWRDGDRAVDCGAGDWAPTDVMDVRVFARARPDQKLGIVDALHSAGSVVAVTGDGVNDAPALRSADIGVAMGGGTEVAQQAARLVLADDSLATVATAVGEGRRVYDNIRRFLRYALSGGIAELLTMLAGPFVGLAIPLLPAQILWINLLTHGLPGVAMGAEPGADDLMRRPPRPAEESVLGAGLGRAAMVTGALIAACTLAVGITADQMSLPWQTLTFLVLGFAQLGVAMAVRARRGPGRRNPWLGAAVALSAALMLAAVGVPALRDLLGTESVSVPQFAVAVAVAAVPGIAVYLSRLRSRSARVGRRRPA
jgi:Ca2+-transporting ATPase